MPAGLLVTVPVPVAPAAGRIATVNASTNRAVTARSLDITTVQVEGPVQSPPQVANSASPVGVAVSGTEVPSRIDTEQAPLVTVAVKVQLTPPGPETIPAPLPDATGSTTR